MSQLNPPQLAAVRYIDGPVLVLAGAGSGKTSVITRKIAYLVNTCGMQARNIAAVTFTNKAAREMKERVGKLLKGSQAEGLQVSTFHNLGLTIIRHHHKQLGFKRGFSIMDGDDTLSLLKDLLLQANGLADRAPIIAQQISSWKNQLVSPAGALALASSKGEENFALLYEQYDRLLRAYNGVDFDDLISLPARLFAEDSGVLEQWQHRIHYLLVDEYQDTNNAQYQLVRSLVGNRNGLTVVGDDDQSIYAWRGARPENLALLKTDFPALKVIMLEQNYRSTARILQAANAIISNNQHVFDKKLWCELGHGDPIRIIHCENDEAELDTVVAEIMSATIRKRAAFQDFAILYRGNHQSRALELKLQQNQIPYQISGGTSFFARGEIKDVMAYLRLLVNPDDDSAFLRIINTPRRKIGTSTLEALGVYAKHAHTSMYGSCVAAGLASHLPEQGLNRLREFHHWLDGLRQRAQREPIAAIKQLIDDVHYKSWLLQNAASPQTAERRMDNVWALVDSLQDSLKLPDVQDINDAVARLLLRDLLDQQDEEQATNQVQLLTLHAAKGLEFPHVFMIGMEENLLPHRNSIVEGNIEEERRLCYVGITRARQSLVMTLARKRRQYGKQVDCDPSRFIDELPSDICQFEGTGEVNPEQLAAKGRDTLDSLRSLLGK